MTSMIALAYLAVGAVIAAQVRSAARRYPRRHPQQPAFNKAQLVMLVLVWPLIVIEYVSARIDQ